MVRYNQNPFKNVYVMPLTERSLRQVRGRGGLERSWTAMGIVMKGKVAYADFDAKPKRLQFICKHGKKTAEVIVWKVGVD
jgi:hypothetical protein